MHVSVELLRELAGAQLELLELNFRRLFCAQLPPPPYPYTNYQYVYPNPNGAPKCQSHNKDGYNLGTALSESDIATAAGVGPHNPQNITPQEAQAAQAAAAHALNKLRAFADVKDR